MSKVKHVLISTLVPLGIVGLISLAAYLFCGAGLAANDCYEQYVPFFNAYYDIIKGGKSIFYSLTGSMGYDFWAVFSYYLVSPLNLIMLFFDKADIVYVVNVLIIIKIAFCGGAFSVFIKNRFPKAKCSRIVMFSTIYALSGFVAGYLWNIMWLDGIMLFPLVIMGMDILMREKNHKWYWYTVFLAMLIVNSYFIGYMCCIFIFLYFFTYNFRNFKDFIRKFFTMGASSLLAIGIGAVILMPALGGLQGTYISGEVFPASEFYGSYVDSFKSVMMAVPPNGITFSSQYANLFMTTFVMLMAFTYFTTGSVSLNKKVRTGLLLGILLFSLNFRPLNFIWHGMHEQTGIPNRFSFMIIFLMLTMAFEVCNKKRRQVKKSSIFAAAGILALCYGIMAYFDNSLIIPAVITAAFLAVYVIIMGFAAGRIKFILVQIFVYCETIIVFLSAILTVSARPIGDYGYYINDFNTINAQKDNGYYREKIDEVYTDREDYFMYDMVLNEDNLSVDTIKEYCDYMKNMGHMSVVNEATVYGINAMSLFNTFNNYGLTGLYCSTGAAGGTNNAMYFGENAFMDMMLGVKYYYTRYYDVKSSSYEYIKTVGEVDIYQNKYALSVGYAVPDEFAEGGLSDDGNPFVVMNGMSSSITGQNVFTMNEVSLAEDNMAVDGTRLYSVEVDSDQELLVYPKASNLRRVEVYINGEKVYTGNRSMSVIDLGDVREGDSVEVLLIFSLSDDVSDDTNSSVYSAEVSEQAIADVYNTLSQNQFTVTGYNDDRLKGTIELEETSDVLFTIPYVKGESIIAGLLPESIRDTYESILPAGGWTITVDGETMEAEKWNDIFIMLELDAGKHNIEMIYITPGFYEGAAISLVSAAIFVLALAITLVAAHGRKKALAAAEGEENISPDRDESAPSETPETGEGVSPESFESMMPEADETESSEADEKALPEENEAELLQSVESTLPESDEKALPEENEAGPSQTDESTFSETEAEVCENESEKSEISEPDMAEKAAKTGKTKPAKKNRRRKNQQPIAVFNLTSTVVNPDEENQDL